MDTTPSPLQPSTGTTDELFAALAARDKPTFKALVKGGAPLNGLDARGWTPLMVCIDQKNIEFLRMLLEAGVDLEVKDKAGQTALIRAAAKNFLGAVKQLLAAGADRKAVAANGQTAHAVAVAKGHSEVARLVKVAP